MGTSLREIHQEDVAPLQELADRDGHDLWIPTHIIEKDGEMIGSVSCDGIPMSTVFISKEVNSPITLRAVHKGIEDVYRNYGDRRYFVCVPPTSPGYRFMPAGGYAGFDVTLWYKEIDA